MRTTIRFSVTALAVGLAACAPSKTDTAKDEIARDLQLASATTMDLAAPKVNPALLTLETTPKGTPLPAKVVRKAEGPKAVESPAPTVEATPEPEPAPVEQATEAEAPAPAPAPVETNEPVAVAPRSPPPAAIPARGGAVQTSGDYGVGTGVLVGVVIGSVLRGGGVDGDHCQLHGTGRRGSRVGSIYVPRPPVYVRAGPR